MGHIIWEGPSQINGEPIVGVLTHASANSKLTDRLHAELLQLWILPGDVHPADAIKSGKDESVCGSCPMRSWRDGEKVHRLCYVSVKPITSIWRGLQRGIYTRATPEEAVRDSRARLLRLGAWGDPTALPFEVVDRLATAARAAGIQRRAGYTHQWTSCDGRWRELLMASCEGTLQSLHARRLGWRTFSAVLPGADIGGEEIRCPASNEMGHKTTCERCGLCDGAQAGDNRKSIVIDVHGLSQLTKQRELALLMERVQRATEAA